MSFIFRGGRERGVKLGEHISLKKVQESLRKLVEVQKFHFSVSKTKFLSAAITTVNEI